MKFPICTEEQLRRKIECLKDARDISVELDIEYRLGGSTLLSIIRDGDILPWSTGVTMHYKEEDFLPVADAFVEKLIERGYDAKTYRAKKIKAFKSEDIFMELIAWAPHGDYRVRKKYKLPGYLFDETETILLRDLSFQTFSPPEDYLAFRYRDWQTPINSNDRRKIDNPQYHRGGA